MDTNHQARIENPTLLVVDDRRENIAYIREAVVDLQINIEEAHDAFDAYAKINRGNTYFLILLDVNMPNMTGLELAKKLKEENIPVPPIIFVTSKDPSTSEINQAYKWGAVDYLSHPIDKNIIMHKINIFLQLFMQTLELVAVLDKLSASQIQLESRNFELDRLAHHDSLTQLPNRRQFEETFMQCLSHAERHHTHGAILFIDLDKFKHVNDSYGHGVGDKLLVMIAGKLKACLRRGDFLARIAGDEFAVVLSDLPESHDAGIVASKIVDAVAQSYRIDGHSVLASTSIGIACFPSEGDKTLDLLQKADMALYKAKNRGGNRYCYYTEDLEKEHHEYIRVQSKLQGAIDNSDFYLVYQPKVDLKTNQIVAVEALIRWKVENENFVLPPSAFLPIAERHNCILDIENMVLQEACAQLKRWQYAGYDNLKLAINLSAIQVQRIDFYDSLIDVLEQFRIQASALEFELSEEAMIQGQSGAQYFIEQLTHAGSKVSIDNFGQDALPITYLDVLPIHCLNLDRKLIADNGYSLTSSKHEKFVTLISQFAKGLGIKILAKGIESQSQYKKAIMSGCDFGQGYYFSKPVSESEIVDLLKSGNNIIKPHTPF